MLGRLGATVSTAATVGRYALYGTAATAVALNVTCAGPPTRTARISASNYSLTVPFTQWLRVARWQARRATSRDLFYQTVPCCATHGARFCPHNVSDDSVGLITWNDVNTIESRRPLCTQNAAALHASRRSVHGSGTVLAFAQPVETVPCLESWIMRQLGLDADQRSLADVLPTNRTIIIRDDNAGDRLSHHPDLPSLKATCKANRLTIVIIQRNRSSDF